MSYFFVTGFSQDETFPTEYRNVPCFQKPFDVPDLEEMVTGRFSHATRPVRSHRPTGPSPTSTRLDQARKWRLKAKELRTIAESMVGKLSHRTYVRLADDYQTMAERAEREAHRRRERDRDAG